jgi:hypothetical protein
MKSKIKKPRRSQGFLQMNYKKSHKKRSLLVRNDSCFQAFQFVVLYLRLKILLTKLTGTHFQSFYNLLHFFVLNIKSSRNV